MTTVAALMKDRLNCKEGNRWHFLTRFFGRRSGYNYKCNDSDHCCGNQPALPLTFLVKIVIMPDGDACKCESGKDGPVVVQSESNREMVADHYKYYRQR